ncbi:hypothetical protein NBRC116594_02130 [Shimia sp. NS0008-38b]
MYGARNEILRNVGTLNSGFEVSGGGGTYRENIRSCEPTLKKPLLEKRHVAWHPLQPAFPTNRENPFLALSLIAFVSPSTQ